MIIVAGQILVEPEQREEYLQSCIEVIEQARNAPGCLHFALTADLVTAGRINVFGGWESAEAVGVLSRRALPWHPRVARLSRTSGRSPDITPDIALCHLAAGGWCARAHPSAWTRIVPSGRTS
jgi:Antibiotic biosynthesis monooxygenase